MDMTLLKTLEDAGFTNKEARVYLALLVLGEGTVTQISKKTELKRSIIYVILESLIKRGFANEKPSTKINRYFAVDPSRILAHLQVVTTNFKEMIPLFKSIYNKSDKKPRINFFEGKEAIVKVYREINSSNNAKFFTSIHRISQYLPGEVEMWIREVQKNLIVPNAKHILSDSPEDRNYAKNIHGHNKNQVRVLKNVKDIEIDLSIFEGKVALTSFSKNIFMVVINSVEVFNSVSILFDLAWEHASRVNYDNL